MQIAGITKKDEKQTDLFVAMSRKIPFRQINILEERSLSPLTDSSPGRRIIRLTAIVE
jgi:hypothetical protein